MKPLVGHQFGLADDDADTVDRAYDPGPGNGGGLGRISQGQAALLDAEGDGLADRMTAGCFHGADPVEECLLVAVSDHV